MALKPVTSKKRAASPLQRPVVSPFASAYTKETKSYAGFWIVLLLAVAGGGFYYAYNHREQAPVKAKPKVIVSGNPQWAEGAAAGDVSPSAGRKKTALGTVGAAE